MALPDFEKMLVDSSRLVADIVVNEVGRDREKMEELFRLAIEEKGQLAMRSARAFDLTDEKFVGMAQPFLSRIIFGLKEFEHQSVVRCFLRTLTRYPVPEDEDELGHLYQLTIDFMRDPKKAIAIRYYGIIMAYEIACTLPDLRFELFSIYDEIALDSGKPLTFRAKYYKKQLIKRFGIE